MLVMDSGLGGLSVVRALRAAQPGLVLHYLADTAGFPYGSRDPAALTARAISLLRTVVMQGSPSTIVLACNTLSTLSLETLRQAFPYPFVGTVPAVKVAAAQSVTRRFTLLATPNTAQSSYSGALISEFAPDCVVDCYGAPNLASYAEQILLGKPVDRDALRAEIAPAFQDDARGKTDAVVLGCTHYPLILEQLQEVAPWPVAWIDSGDAIARRALTFAAQEEPAVGASIAYVTAAADQARYEDVFWREGFTKVRLLT